MNRNINIELVTNSDEIKFSELSDFMIGCKISNNSQAIEHVDVSEIALFVNGKRSEEWDLAVQNGTIVNLKINTKSNKMVRWPLGDALFPFPGKYELKLVWGAMEEKKEVLVK